MNISPINSRCFLARLRAVTISTTTVAAAGVAAGAAMAPVTVVAPGATSIVPPVPPWPLAAAPSAPPLALPLVTRACDRRKAVIAQRNNFLGVKLLVERFKIRRRERSTRPYRRRRWCGDLVVGG